MQCSTRVSKSYNHGITNCSKYLRICANFGQIYVKQEKIVQNSCICHNLTKFFNFYKFYVIFTSCFCSRNFNQSILILILILIESLCSAAWFIKVQHTVTVRYRPFALIWTDLFPFASRPNDKKRVHLFIWWTFQSLKIGYLVYTRFFQRI